MLRLCMASGNADGGCRCGLLTRVPVFETLGDPPTCATSPQVAVPAPLRGPPGHLPRGRRERHVLHRRAPATPAPSASTPTAARSRSRTSAPATSSASWRCSTTSAARPPSRRSTRSRRSRSSARTCAACCASTPTSRSSSSIALGRRLREANERLARQSFQTVQSRVADGARPARRARPRRRAPADRDVLVTATQADIAQLAGSSRESASRFLAVLERAGVVTQGRGRLDRARPGGAGRLRLLMRAEREFSAAAWSCAATSASSSCRPAARPAAARCSRCPRATSTRARRRRRPPRARSARRPASRPSSSRSSATSATGTSATAGGSPRSSTSTCSTTVGGDAGRPRRRGRGRALDAARARPRGLSYTGEREMARSAPCRRRVRPVGSAPPCRS